MLNRVFRSRSRTGLIQPRQRIGSGLGELMVNGQHGVRVMVTVTVTVTITIRGGRQAFSRKLIAEGRTKYQIEPVWAAAPSRTIAIPISDYSPDLLSSCMQAVSARKVFFPILDAADPKLQHHSHGCLLQHQETRLRLVWVAVQQGGLMGPMVEKQGAFRLLESSGACTMISPRSHSVGRSHARQSPTTATAARRS